MKNAETVLFVVRHGEIDPNRENRVGGQLNFPLNSKGKMQAQLAAEALVHERIGSLYSSDLLRAIQTAQPISEATGLPILLDPDLRERRFGVFEDRLLEEIRNERPSDWVAGWIKREPDYAPEHGESLREFHERCTAAFMAIAVRHPGEVICVVTHGGVMSCLHHIGTNLPLGPRHWQPAANAAISKFVLHPEHGLALRNWNDSSHLSVLSVLEES